MLPLLAAFLLAAWLIQPWGYIRLPGEDAHAQGLTAAAGSYEPDFARLDHLFAKETRAAELATAQPALTPTPPTTPSPAPSPSPAPPPAPPAPAYVPPPDGLEALVCSYAWPCQEALTVARCESGVDAAGRLDGIYAQSSRNSYGLFQINAIHARRFPEFWDSWMDPAKNTAWAFQIWSEQGWRPWNCRPG